MPPVHVRRRIAGDMSLLPVRTPQLAVPLLAGLLAVLVAVAAVLLAGVQAGSSGPDDETRRVAGSPSLRLDVDKVVPVSDSTGAATMQDHLDRCDGPVLVRFAGLRERLLAEHDYCGGRWILRLRADQVLRLAGDSVGGIYQVNGRTDVVPKGTSAGVIRGLGDVVAQTCRPDGRTLRLVGLTRVA